MAHFTSDVAEETPVGTGVATSAAVAAMETGPDFGGEALPIEALDTVVPLIAKTLRPITFSGAGNVFQLVDDVEDTELMFDARVYSGIANLLWEFEERGFNQKNLVVARYLTSSSRHSWPLKRKVYDLFKGNTEPTGLSFMESEAPLELWARYAKTDRQNPPLVEKMALDFRDQDKSSFVWFAPAIFFWPPPLTTGPETHYDQFWEFRLNGERKNDGVTLATLVHYIKKEYKGFLFAGVSHTSGPSRVFLILLYPSGDG